MAASDLHYRGTNNGDWELPDALAAMGDLVHYLDQYWVVGPGNAHRPFCIYPWRDASINFKRARYPDTIQLELVCTRSQLKIEPEIRLHDPRYARAIAQFLKPKPAAGAPPQFESEVIVIHGKRYLSLEGENRWNLTPFTLEDLWTASPIPIDVLHLAECDLTNADLPQIISVVEKWQPSVLNLAYNNLDAFTSSEATLLQALLSAPTLKYLVMIGNGCANIINAAYLKSSTLSSTWLSLRNQFCRS